MESRRHERVAGAARWMAVAVLAVGAAGGEDSAPPPAPPKASTQPSQPATDPAGPALPQGVTEETDAGMQILVKTPRLHRTADQGAYRKDDRVPIGRLVGAVKWADPVIPRQAAAKLLEEPVDLDGLDPNSVEALEVYHGLSETPIQYMNHCGVILIWLKH